MTERVHKPRSERKAEEPEEESSKAVKSGDELKAELDDLIDEIDEVLEDNDALGLNEVLDWVDEEIDMTTAEDTIKNFVQKGGQ